MELIQIELGDGRAPATAPGGYCRRGALIGGP
jgi:hypothetical protein